MYLFSDVHLYFTLIAQVTAKVGGYTLRKTHKYNIEKKFNIDFKFENIISDYGNNGNMNGAEFPNVPVTTLSGLATLTQRK